MFLYLVLLLPLQFLAYTLICPEFELLDGAQTTTDVVPWPEEIIRPPVADQTQLDASVTEGITYVSQVPLQITDDPVIAEGIAGLCLIILTLLQVLGPPAGQPAFFALTQIKPVFKRELAQIVIDVPVEIPELPPGIVQMYSVAPGTGAMLQVAHWPLQSPAGPDIGPGAGGQVGVQLITAVAVAVQP